MTGHRRSARSCDVSGDVGRAAVYACELAAFDGTDLEDQRSFVEVERIIRSIAESPWWSGPVVAVRRARAGTMSSVAAGSVGRHDAPIETLIDQDLLQFETIWAAAGTPHAVFSIDPHQLARATGGRVLAIAASGQHL